MGKFKIILSICIIFFGVLIGSAIVVQAQDDAGITFPIAELNNCASKQDCKVYCDDPANIEACVSFAETHNLMPKEEAQIARRIAKPLQRGETPGGCRSKDACEAYCESPDHADECLAFAEKYGIKPEKEIQDARRIVKIMREEGGPGNCRSKGECEAYCGNADHSEECLAFAEKAGFMDQKELEMARKVLPLMARGETPGGCRSKDACEAYCSGGEHFDECIAFAERLGFADEKEIQMAKKTRGKGPGGCMGRAECESFCNNPNNQEQCFAFAKEHGFIPEEGLERAKEGFQRAQQGFTNIPEEVRNCLRERLGDDVFEKMNSGNFSPSPAIGEKMHACFEGFSSNNFEDEEGESANRRIMRPHPDVGVPDNVRTCMEKLFGGNQPASLEEKSRLGECVRGFVAPESRQNKDFNERPYVPGNFNEEEIKRIEEQRRFEEIQRQQFQNNLQNFERPFEGNMPSPTSSEFIKPPEETFVVPIEPTRTEVSEPTQTQ